MKIIPDNLLECIKSSEIDLTNSRMFISHEQELHNKSVTCDQCGKDIIVTGSTNASNDFKSQFVEYEMFANCCGKDIQINMDKIKQL